MLGLIHIHKRTTIRFRQAIDKPHIRKLVVMTGLDFENQKDSVVFWFGWQLYTLRLMFTVQAQIECHSKWFQHRCWIMATSSHIEKGLLSRKRTGGWSLIAIKSNKKYQERSCFAKAIPRQLRFDRFDPCEKECPSCIRETSSNRETSSKQLWSGLHIVKSTLYI